MFIYNCTMTGTTIDLLLCIHILFAVGLGVIRHYFGWEHPNRHKACNDCCHFQDVDESNYAK